jgi:hypothetical protein
MPVFYFTFSFGEAIRLAAEKALGEMSIKVIDF